MVSTRILIRLELYQFFSYSPAWKTLDSTATAPCPRWTRIIHEKTNQLFRYTQRREREYIGRKTLQVYCNLDHVYGQNRRLEPHEWLEENERKDRESWNHDKDHGRLNERNKRDCVLAVTSSTSHIPKLHLARGARFEH